MPLGCHSLVTPLECWSALRLSPKILPCFGRNCYFNSLLVDWLLVATKRSGFRMQNVATQGDVSLGRVECKSNVRMDD